MLYATECVLSKLNLAVVRHLIRNENKASAVSCIQLNACEIKQTLKHRILNYNIFSILHVNYHLLGLSLNPLHLS